MLLLLNQLSPLCVRSQRWRRGGWNSCICATWCAQATSGSKTCPPNPWNCLMLSITFLSSFLPSVLHHFLIQVLHYPVKAKQMMIKPHPCSQTPKLLGMREQMMPQQGGSDHHCDQNWDGQWVWASTAMTHHPAQGKLAGFSEDSTRVSFWAGQQSRLIVNTGDSGGAASRSIVLTKVLFSVSCRSVGW